MFTSGWRKYRFVFLGVMTGVLTFCLAPAAQAEDFEFFEQHVRPILVDHCYKCHSAQSTKVKGKLWLDTKAGVLAGGENGAVVIPGDPEKSRLIVAVRYTDDDLQMPPKERLSGQQIADLAAWIKMGAPDPRVGPVAATAPAATQPYDFVGARRMWAFSKPVAPPIPKVRQRDWCRSPIDHFILAKLEERGLSPAAQADKRTLIRRATFDLTGLPPTVAEIDAFLTDESPDAFAHVVDCLLASPHYGEHWARHWLDVVRYADSSDARGLGSVGDIGEAYRYRDWVVNSLNADMPYDQFVENQIAGDLLPPPKPIDKPGELNADGIIATGVYAIGNWGGGDADKEKMLTDIVDDQVDVTGRAFLGLTLACARCHDHKFDPIPTADYYSLAGIFFSSHILPGPGVKTQGSPVLRIPLASPAELVQVQQHDARVAELQKKIDTYAQAQKQEVLRTMLRGTDRYLVAAWEFENAHASDAAAFATQRQLDPVVFSHWVEYLASFQQSAPPPKLLTKPISHAAGIDGVEVLIGADGRPCPCVTANGTDHVVNIGTVTLPPRSLSVHPGPSSAVAVSWTSPVAATVRISGRVTDADAHCGDGIAWKLNHRPASGPSHELAVGDFVNGGAQDFAAVQGAARLAAVAVKPGDRIELIVDPKGEYTCDTTVVEFQIAEQGGRTWDLRSEVVGHLIEPGEKSPWQFYETELLANSHDLPADGALSKWLALSAAHPTADQVQVGAEQVRDALLSIDSAPAYDRPDAQVYRDLLAPRGRFWHGTVPEEATLSPSAKANLAAMRADLAALKKDTPTIRYAHGFQDGGTPSTIYAGIHDVAIHIRGRYDRLAEVVPRRFPRLLAGDDRTPLSQLTKGSGRLELARWVASPDNPLTARVMVNRIWQHHFGQGIVRTPNNFGKLGTPPTHPELLDYLATQFIADGWSIKAMHRAIMLSAAYQQSSVPAAATFQADPGNLLVGRMNRRRLEAEELRDALLAATDSLSPDMGGPSVNDLNTPRRTLYLMTIRSDRSNYRMLFDAADPTGIVEQRIDSTVAPQALFLMNSAFAMARSETLAESVKKRGGDDRARIEWLYRRLYGREPVDAEVRIGLEFLDRAVPEMRWSEYCQILLCANEFVYVD